MLGNYSVTNSVIKTNSKKTIKPQPEVFLNNRLDKDVQRIVRPLNLMLALFFTSKYVIRDDYITPKKSNKFVILVFFAMFIAYGVFLINMMKEDPVDYEKLYSSRNIIYWFLFFYMFYTVGFTMLFILNTVHSESNISLILTIQKINSTIDFSNHISGFVIWNWISALGIGGLNMFMFILYYVWFNHFNFIESFADWMFISFDVNLICAVRFIKLLEKYVVIWKNSVLMVSDEECDVTKLFEVYQNILEAYKLYKKVFQLMILFHTIDTFCRSLSYLSLLLNFVTSVEKERVEDEENSSKVTATSILVVWLFKDILLVIEQSILCERLYIAIQDAESTCIEKLKNVNHPENQDQLFNNVILANRTSFSKMSACGLFDIDASLPMHFMGLLTTYVIVLLQITFL